MKKLNKLKLNNLVIEELTGDQMKSIKGGYSYCQGSCYYADSGGSSTGDNCAANSKLGGGYSTQGGGGTYC